MTRSTAFPRSNRDGNPYSLYRIRGVKPQRFLCLSPAWLGIESHYSGGVSILCPGDAECEHCQKRKILPRWRGYVLAQQQWGRQTIVCLEFTERAARSFMDRLDQFDSLRGHLFTGRRLKESQNAAMEIVFERDVLAESYLPPVPPISKCLAAVYKVSPDLLAGGDPLAESNGSKESASLADHFRKKMHGKL